MVDGASFAWTMKILFEGRIALALVELARFRNPMLLVLALLKPGIVVVVEFCDDVISDLVHERH
jgi:hypothetical protein